MNKFGITEKSLKIIIQTLSTFSVIERAVIFGSRAKGNYKKGSDIDIAIYGSHLSESTALNLNAKLNEEQPIPYFIDVVSPLFLENASLREHIDRVGIEFYCKKAN